MDNVVAAYKGYLKHLEMYKDKYVPKYVPKPPCPLGTTINETVQMAGC